MSLHTSVNRLAIKSQISLCLIEGSLSLAHESACSTVKLLPQSHFDGSLDGGQPYCRANASRKADLCREKPCSVRGRTVSHVQAPFSFARSAALCSCSNRLFRQATEILCFLNPLFLTLPASDGYVLRLECRNSEVRQRVAS